MEANTTTPRAQRESPILPRAYLRVQARSAELTANTPSNPRQPTAKHRESVQRQLFFPTPPTNQPPNQRNPTPQPLAPDPRPKTDRASADRAGTSIGSEHHPPRAQRESPILPLSFPASAGSIRRAHPPTHHPTHDNPQPNTATLFNDNYSSPRPPDPTHNQRNFTLPSRWPLIPDRKLTERQRIGPERALEANPTPLAHSAKAQSSPELPCECRLDPQSPPADTPSNPQQPTPNLLSPPAPLIPDPQPKHPDPPFHR